MKKADIIPLATLMECLAIIGRTGAGKSYTARGLVERVLDAGERVCIIDPTGVWFGLRLGADGKKAGYPVVVFGGDYADVKIGEHSGPALAELIAGRNLPCVIDVSEFTIGARTRFLTQFLETLYIKNPKTPLTLVVDEADMVAPQRIQPDQTVMFSRLEQIVRRGRVRGFRPWLITQRPAELHKSVLSQAATLIALKLTSPQDRKAAEEWVMGHGDKEQGKEVLSSLAGLNRGEGWAWCPGSDILERVQFPKIKTYDSMRTPQVGSSHPAPAKLSDVDLSAIQDGLKAVEAEVAANDPRKLKARIAELERAAKSVAPSPIIDQSALDTAHLEGFNAGMLEGWLQAKMAAQPIVTAINDAAAGLLNLGGKPPAAPAPRRMEQRRPMPAASFRVILKSNGHAPTTSLPIGERAVLRAAAQYPDGVGRDQLSVLIGYKRSSRDAYIARLKEKGLVETPGALVLATQAGVNALGPDYEPLPTGPALQDYWLAKLPEGEKKILGELLTAYPQPVERSALDDATGYKRSSRDAYISRLTARRLVVSESGAVRASDTLFAA